jgi:hypothetical protein
MDAKSSFDGLYESAVAEAICSPVGSNFDLFRIPQRSGLASGSSRILRDVFRTSCGPLALPKASEDTRKAGAMPA